MIREFRPALFFLLRFVGVYVIGNILSGLYVEPYDDGPDSATQVVARHASWVLHQCGEVTAVQNGTGDPTVYLHNEDGVALSFFEGCNGINVMIVFFAFIVAFGGSWKRMTWFVPLGLFIIHLANLGRLSLLYFAAIYYQSYFYFIH